MENNENKTNNFFMSSNNEELEPNSNENNEYINNFKNNNENENEDNNTSTSNYPNSDEVNKTEIKRSSTLNSNKKDHFIIVSNPVTTDGVGSYTAYTVESSIGKKATLKRYSEFDFLRKKLAERWPGIYIPALPEKKVIGNKDTKFIDTRCKLLDQFLKKLIKFEYFQKSEELKVFLTESNDVEKALERISPKDSLEEIMIRYKASFVNLVSDKLSSYSYEGYKRIEVFSIQLQTKVTNTIKVRK